MNENNNQHSVTEVPEEYKRSIRSFVLRQGHMTAAQQRAIDTLWPRFGVDYCDSLVDLQQCFGGGNDKVLEIGFGMGVATVEIAKRLPDKDFLAIDVHGPGVGNILKLIEEENVQNIRVMRHDAVEVVENMLADGSLDGIHIFFPDPWHKKRHNKRRLIQTAFVAKLLPKLKSGGYIHLATDWEEYAQQMLEVLSGFDNLQNTAAGGEGYVPTPDYRPETKFEARGKRLGHGVWDLVFRKR
ncbi:tRNA (guanine-N7)-methyltransferase [Neisseria arctica]|uniref:tRNA (guanine-N(7)-)-methyltransferase n=1 Tax=Neisseria arctica TaxID=1470200 RepID=A0A0J0YQJ5_9NEIS|nr:tRNA (guanosine(46)-N7)-methyltransferase TrmB [Neisseria arctica]KLT72387.1 tRNA (guanine-N7)-methyltransferase [Neisseria arctica]UOO86040.1 tRNA (guanosine(46)-N7)-methyltransferase TrmB [Neisseria arctica]